MAIRQPYLRLLHLELDTGMSAGTSAFGSKFSPEEEEEFAHMARSESFYETFATSVAPSIYGTVGVLSTVLRILRSSFSKLGRLICPFDSQISKKPSPAYCLVAPGKCYQMACACVGISMSFSLETLAQQSLNYSSSLRRLPPLQCILPGKAAVQQV